MDDFAELIGIWALCYIAYRIFIFIYLHFWRKFDWSNFKGEWALVTGASMGLGEALAEGLASRGMNVVLVARSRELLEKKAVELQERFSIKAKAVPADFLNPEAYDVLKRELEGLTVSVLVNNVGGEPKMQKWLDYTEEDQQLTTALNLIPTFRLTRMLLPSMRHRRKGAILNVSSQSSEFGCLTANYASDKAKINTLSRALNIEEAANGILVQSSMFGMVSTPATRKMSGGFLMISCCDAAESALNRFGWGSLITTHWVHDLSGLLLWMLPESVAKTLYFQTVQVKALELKAD